MRVITRQFSRIWPRAVSAGEFDEPGSFYSVCTNQVQLYIFLVIYCHRKTNTETRSCKNISVFRTTDLKKISLRPNSHHQLVKSRTKVIKNGCFMKIF